MTYLHTPPPKPANSAARSWGSPGQRQHQIPQEGAATAERPPATLALGGPPAEWGRLFTSAADVHRRARGRYQRVEERGDVGRDPHAAMGGRPARHVGVPVDREGGADEEHGVVHPAERRCHPAWHERKGGEVAGRRDGVAAAVRRAEVVPAAGGYVADQRDMVAPVEDENLILQVDLDPQPAAMGDQYLGRPRAGQGRLHRGTHRVPRGQALRLLERPYGLKGV